MGLRNKEQNHAFSMNPGKTSISVVRKLSTPLFHLNMQRAVAGKVTRASTGRRSIWSYGYKVAKGMMPKISPTERAALNAGTVGFDKSIFTGDPSLRDLAKYNIKCSDEEQAFLDNEVQALCEMLDDYQITEVNEAILLSPFAC